MKPQIVEKIKQNCQSYFRSLKSKKLFPLFVDGGKLEYESFENTIVPTKYDYKSMFAGYIDDDFNKTISTSIIAENFGNPYIIFPMGNIKTFFNEDIEDLRNSLYLAQLSSVNQNPVIMNPNISFYKNIINLFWAIGEKHNFLKNDKNKITRVKTNSYTINRAIQTLKGKISIAKKNIKDPEKQQAKIEALKKAISDLRAQKYIELSEPEQIITQVSRELIRNTGHVGVHYFIAGHDMSKYLDEKLKNEFMKKMSGTVGSLATVSRQAKDDIFNTIDKIAGGYSTNKTISPTAEYEILLSCSSNHYFMVKYTPENVELVNKVFKMEIGK